MSTFNVNEYQDKYGEELGETFFHVHMQWCRLFTIFTQYSNLFGKSKERVSLLNDTAGPFFKNVQDTFHDEILLGICRLTDPESKKKKNPSRNVSVLRLAKLLEHHEAAVKISDLASDAEMTAEFARAQRNKKISHSDLDVAINTSSMASGASIIQMRGAIKAIHEVIFSIGQDIGGVHLAPWVIGSRSEFGLMNSLFDAKQGEKALHLQKVEQMKRDHNYQQYPDWLFNDDEESNWR